MCFSCLSGMWLTMEHRVLCTDGHFMYVCVCVCVRVCVCVCRLPVETESAALGAALQAAACASGQTVTDYITQHPPPLSQEVRRA